MFIDQNAALCPSSPLEPLFRAVLVQDPDFSLRNVDLVTDRGNIRKLLCFVQGSTNEHFRILVEVVGDGDTSTALFTRVETKTTETIRGFCGFGRSLRSWRVCCAMSFPRCASRGLAKLLWSALGGRVYRWSLGMESQRCLMSCTAD